MKANAIIKTVEMVVVIFLFLTPALLDGQVLGRNTPIAGPPVEAPVAKAAIVTPGPGAPGTPAPVAAAAVLTPGPGAPGINAPVAKAAVITPGPGAPGTPAPVAKAAVVTPGPGAPGPGVAGNPRRR